MILYFNSYITDIPLNPQYDKKNDPIRNTCAAYYLPKKIDIAKYTLASYASVPWRHVIINYELDDHNEYKNFDNYLKNLFPSITITHKRSASNQEFSNSLDLIKKFDDEWIFYAVNNDHPMIAIDPNILNKALEKAAYFKKNNKYVSIIFSHFTEFINLPHPGNPFNAKFGKDAEIIDEDDNFITIIKKTGDNSGIQIIHSELFRHWFCSKNLGDARMIHPEDVSGKVFTFNQIIIIPKTEICAHFDASPHLLGTTIEIRYNQVPPLFIPNGFFEKKIKIAYGYKKYRNNWVNINPTIKKYSFENQKNGTDLKWTLDDIPYFWKNNISEIDKNPKINEKKFKKARDKAYNIKRNPWKPQNFIELSKKQITKSKFKIKYFILKNILNKKI
ncbi:hypothetical protein COX74_02285 [bacterium (Candidatus Gribaldobacteria) CG_4_10_14_0_2_um_filter_41_16]|uniref:Uncharacterized protein n=1 Tax=bacterium (Candidatus Gribaldobacteria) CG_4_10_14_0_2_um_filter_41_16 TaxID=2014265 RepID=A0A2M7VI84_9BACT|nr:MAG: hypothetical protein COX74_02285 [bacterium (Candidatus Gribaldobacteria) CG_4_10_14_0_2_um_filter_41_16]